MQASNFCKWGSLSQATTAGSTSLTVEVDMANFEGCEFLGVAGSTSAIAHTMTIKTGASTTDSFVALSGATKATTSGNDFAIVDVYKPRERWLQAVFSSTAASEKFVICRQYGARKLQSATTYDTAVVSPNT